MSPASSTLRCGSQTTRSSGVCAGPAWSISKVVPPSTSVVLAASQRSAGTSRVFSSIQGKRSSRLAFRRSAAVCELQVLAAVLVRDDLGAQRP